MELSDLAPGIGERGFIAGNSGSGKSTLSRYLALTMASRQPLIIIDPKNEIDIFKGRETVVSKPGDIKNASVIRYVPSLDSDVVSDVDIIMRAAYNAGNVAIWIDELYAVCEGATTGQSLNGLRAVLTRGRSKKVTFLGLAQRPAFLPMFCISETNKQYVFSLPLKNDRDRMAEIIGNDSLLKVLPKYEFWYSETDEPNIVHGPYRLEGV
jgi:energy-coupling factor transporter ATP-binding protein EcfA2